MKPDMMCFINDLQFAFGDTDPNVFGKTNHEMYLEFTESLHIVRSKILGKFGAIEGGTRLVLQVEYMKEKENKNPDILANQISQMNINVLFEKFLEAFPNSAQKDEIAAMNKFKALYKKHRNPLAHGWCRLKPKVDKNSHKILVLAVLNQGKEFCYEIGELKAIEAELQEIGNKLIALAQRI